MSEKKNARELTGKEQQSAIKALKATIEEARQDIYEAMGKFNDETNGTLSVELHLLLVNEHYEIDDLCMKRPELVYEDGNDED